MVFKSALAQMVPALLITIVTGLPFFQATAQIRCEQVFTANATLYDQESWSLFNQFEIAAVYLKSALTKKRGNLTTIELSQRNRRLQYLAERYLLSAGITFEAIPSSLTIEGLRDAPTYQLTYPIYRLTGTAHGAETSRLLYGIQTNPKYSTHPLTVELDPYYFIEGLQKGRQAHFDAWTNKIRFGPDTLSDDFLGLSSNLRHELQHYIEHMKVLRGEMSLARIQFTANNEKSETNVYSKFFAVDEIEAWLRDLRSLLDQDHQDIKNQKYSPLIRPEHRDKLAPFLLGARLTSTKAAIEQIEFFMEQTELTLKAMVADGNITAMRRQKSNDSRHFLQVTLQESPYQILRFELTGLITPAETDTPKMDTVMNDFVLWNERRLTEVSQELVVLKQNFEKKLKALQRE